MNKILLALVFSGLSIQSFADSKSGPVEHKTISFEKGSTNLNESQRTEISKLLKNFMKKGKDVDISIATWSDEPIPSKGKSLSSAQRKIADKRSESIKAYVKQLKLDVDDYEVFNMAESPNFLARTFNTKENKVKSAVKNEAAETSLLKSKYKIIKENGDTGKSVIIVRFDD